MAVVVEENSIRVNKNDMRGRVLLKPPRTIPGGGLEGASEVAQEIE